MSLFRTSKEARDILGTFHKKTTIRPNLWARAALGYSLFLEAEPEQGNYDSEGSEFPEKVFFGEDKESLIALLRQRTGKSLDTGEIGVIIKPHVERGLRHFWDEYLRLNQRGDELILHLLKLCPNQGSMVSSNSFSASLLPKTPRANNFEISLDLGTNKQTNMPVSHILTNQGATPHLAIMGRNGTGKTRTGLSLLKKVKDSAAYPIPCLVFDYAKGDIASNDDFTKTVEADVILMPNDTVPMSPLALPDRDDFTIQMAGRRFRDTICSVVNLGAVQKDLCLRLITDLYQTVVERTPDLTDLTLMAELEYETNDWRPDSLLACLREFSAFPLFRSSSVDDKHNIFQRSHVIDVHRLPEDLRKLTVFLLLDRLFSEIMGLPDAPLDKKGNRQLRLVIVIDEAHHFLPCKQQTLEHIVREVRSKGVAIWLFSQSPDDFDQPRYNFAREMGLSIVFSCFLERPRMLEALLGGRVDPQRLSKLGAGVALTRPPQSEAPIEIQAWP